MPAQSSLNLIKPNLGRNNCDRCHLSLLWLSEDSRRLKNTSTGTDFLQDSGKLNFQVTIKSVF